MRNKIKIENTFAEAFPMKASRLIITTHNIKWGVGRLQNHSVVSQIGNTADAN